MDTDGTKRVVITGIGPVTSIGTGKKQFWEGMLAGRNPARKLPASYRKKYIPKTEFYVPLPEIALRDSGLAGRYDRIMQHETRFALVGTRLALEDAGYRLKTEGDTIVAENFTDACTILGIGIAGLENAFQSYEAHAGTAVAGGDGRHPASRYQRMIIPMLMPNAAAAWVTIFFGLTGGSFTINASCASGTAAIGAAFQRIARGVNQCAVCGGVEALSERSGAILRGFDMLGVLTRAQDGAPQPFSAGRSGFLFAEGGGCILILEELTHALRRNARIYAEIIDYADTSDAFNIVRCDPRGNGIVRLLQRLSAGRTIDYLNTHGTGTELNDATERDAVRAVFGTRDCQPLLNATKGLIGHTLGASGAIEAAVCALSIHHGMIHGNRCDEPFPELNLQRKSRKAAIDCAASVSFGFGGHNCGLAFGKFTDRQ
ncbi:MAG: beta-ketoacyl-[acyl-carrier-protein] synthase family protein [Chitinispirillaceae bacterium]|nr:beta-ketoacyl-[acyl-carrier-protein] synthase family protein [Chitinispirillaceae bacterium]